MPYGGDGEPAAEQERGAAEDDGGVQTGNEGGPAGDEGAEDGDADDAAVLAHQGRAGPRSCWPSVTAGRWQPPPLAAEAGVAASTASVPLAKLVGAGLLDVEAHAGTATTG